MNWATEITDLLWRGALGAIPLALIVAAICRWPSLRPGTRHALWVVVLIAFVAPLGTSYVTIPDLNSFSIVATQPPPTGAEVDFAPPPPIGATIDLLAGYEDWPEGSFVNARPVERGEPTLSTVGDAALPIDSSDYSAIDDVQIGAASPKPVATAENGSNETTGVLPGLRIWAAALIGVRDAIAAIPTMPTAIWVFGAAGVLCVYVASTLRFRRCLRGAERAPEGVEREINRIAREISLRRRPQALMVDENISPMVWCGRRPRLVLPAGLWSQLDRDGRRAILCHELAHLRRRDHWVRWLELAVSVLFWWHPLLWWVRRRVHEEADLCCDAWVTWLMPRRRRQYAEALLTARTYVGSGVSGTPATAMGAMTKGTKRFARRITMVMTKTSLPRTSAAGIGVACVLALAGWIVTPAWSYPPMHSPDTEVVTLASCPETEHQCEHAEHAEHAEHVLRHAEHVATAPIGHVIRVHGEDGELHERLAQLEQEVRRLSKQLGASAHPLRAPAPRVPRIAVVPPVPPVAPVAPTPQAGAALRSLGIGGTMPFGVSEGKTIVRTYKLPKAKLALLTKLMVRDDVPIPVRQVDGGIEVHATASQHRIFAAFCEMIHPTGKKTERFFGQSGGYTTFGADSRWPAGVGGRAKANSARARELYFEHLDDQDCDEHEAAELRAHRAYADGLKVYTQFSEGQTELLDELAEQFAEQAEELEEQAEELRAEAEEIEAQAEEGDGVDRDQMRSLRAAVRELEAQARRLEAQARQIEKKAQKKSERSTSHRKPAKADCVPDDRAL